MFSMYILCRVMRYWNSFSVPRKRQQVQSMGKDKELISMSEVPFLLYIYPFMYRSVMEHGNQIILTIDKFEMWDHELRFILF